MFWDDVHPTADMHSWLAENLKEIFSKIFKFVPPQSLNQNSKALGFWNTPPKPDPKVALPEDLRVLFRYA